MRPIRLLVAICGISFFSSSIYAQQFMHAIIDQDADHNHYSVTLADALDMLVVAGTRYYSANESDCHVMMMDFGGNIIWSVNLDNGQMEYCLDVTVGEQDPVTGGGNIVVTGSVLDNGKHKILINVLETWTGTLIDHNRLEMDFDAFGFSIAYDAQRGQYLLGGMQIDGLDTTLANSSQGFVLGFDTNFGLMWKKDIVGPVSNKTGVNDILVGPEGIYVTGAARAANNDQAFIALLLDHNGGNVIWDKSAERTNSAHAGVGMYYEPDHNGTLYLVSNNSIIHAPQVTVIRDADLPTAYVWREYGVWPQPQGNQGSGYNPAAFGIVPSLRMPKRNIVIMGMYQSFDFSATSTNNSPVFALDINKYGRTRRGGSLYELYNPGYATSGTNLLQAFNGQQPFVYNPSSIVATPDGYVTLGYSLINGRYNLAVIAVDKALRTGTACDRRITNYTSALTSVPVPLTVDEDFYVEYVASSVVWWDRPETVEAICH
ncbi:MAG: hypothetical protein U9Q81_23035 [Pseudomonadota bacterium]|nr:hypothetical protein [Pseudomonadota bacterium]